MDAFRLSREAYADSLSGIGAARMGGRWNSVGVEMIYTAANRALAMAEVAVHFTAATLPDDYMMVTLNIPDNLAMQVISIASLPEGWNNFPYSLSTQIIGDRFVSENNFTILKVPSAVVKGDFNLLLNPFHRDFSRVEIANIEKFPFDSRIFH